MLLVPLLIHTFIQHRFDYLLGMVGSPEIYTGEQVDMVLALMELTYHMLLTDH